MILKRFFRYRNLYYPAIINNFRKSFCSIILSQFSLPSPTKTTLQNRVIHFQKAYINHVKHFGETNFFFNSTPIPSKKPPSQNNLDSTLSNPFLHQIICQNTVSSDNLLRSNYFISSVFKKWPCRNRSMGYNFLYRAGLLQLVTKHRSNALPLVIFVNIQPIQIARLRNVAKPNNHFILNCNHTVMRLKR